jgi:hypothetical protein
MKVRGTTVAALIALLLAGCTPTDGKHGGGGGAQPPRPPAAAEPLVHGAILVVQTTDVKTGALVTPNERDYPLFVVVDVKNHQQESAELFPEHLLITKNPSKHTVMWPQVDQFDHAEALLSAPILTPGQIVTCRWTDLNGVPYPNTAAIAQYRGSPAGVNRPGDQGGTVCTLSRSML